MELSFRSSVNSWECDENDHLNVRYYVDKHWQTLVGGLQRSGWLQGHVQLQMQHIRFLRECRLAAPLSGFWGVVDVQQDHIDVLTQLHQEGDTRSSSTCIHRLPSSVFSSSVSVTDRIPAEAGARGVQDADLSYTRLNSADLSSYGFRVIGMGVIQPVEAAKDDRLLVHHYMGRLSDSMPHLWQFLRDNTQPDGVDEGGAVLEYRLRYHQPLVLGDHYVINSGLLACAEKVQQFAHLCHRQADGALCFSAEAVALRMNLDTRKVISMNREELERMAQKQLKPFSAERN